MCPCIEQFSLTCERTSDFVFFANVLPDGNLNLSVRLTLSLHDQVLALVTGSSEETDAFAVKDGDPQLHYYYDMLLAILIIVVLLAIYETARPKRRDASDTVDIESLSPSQVCHSPQSF